jgi:hypothetical protein
MSGLDTSQPVTDEASLKAGHMDEAAHEIEQAEAVTSKAPADAAKPPPAATSDS